MVKPLPSRRSQAMPADRRRADARPPDHRSPPSPRPRRTARAPGRARGLTTESTSRARAPCCSSSCGAGPAAATARSSPTTTSRRSTAASSSRALRGGRRDVLARAVPAGERSKSLEQAVGGVALARGQPARAAATCCRASAAAWSATWRLGGERLHARHPVRQRADDAARAGRRRARRQGRGQPRRWPRTCSARSTSRAAVVTDVVLPALARAAATCAPGWRSAIKKAVIASPDVLGAHRATTPSAMLARDLGALEALVRGATRDQDGADRARPVRGRPPPAAELRPHDRAPARDGHGLRPAAARRGGRLRHGRRGARSPPRAGCSTARRSRRAWSACCGGCGAARHGATTCRCAIDGDGGARARWTRCARSARAACATSCPTALGETVIADDVERRARCAALAPATLRSSPRCTVI